MQIISKVDLSYLNSNLIEQMKFNDTTTNNTNNYIQMSNLSSGDSPATSTNSFISSSSGNPMRSSFRFNNQELSTTTTSSLKSVFKFPLPPQQQQQLKANDLNDVEFIDDGSNENEENNNNNNNNKKSDNNEDDPGSAVYNFPWDFKLKSLIPSSSAAEVSSSSLSTSQSTTNLQSSQFPPPSKPTETNEQDETQYCSPWDLKLQEEMFKMMSQQQQSKPNGTNSGSNSRNNSLKLNEDISTTSASLSSSSSFKKHNSDQHLRRGDEFNSSIKSNKSLKESSANTTIESSSLNGAVISSTLIEQNENENEYSPPWEHKQSLLLQNLTNGTNNQNTKSISPPISAPLATSSAISTLTNSSNINQNSQAINSLFNQFSRARLSTRSNTSSSSSSHSSTSSLSTNSPPSIPPPPLPPSIPPPPPPTSSLTASLASSSSLNNSNNNRLLQQQQQQQTNCQSPRLMHRHICQQNTLQSTNSNILLTRVNNPNLNSTANSTASFAIVPMIGPTGSNLITCPIINSNNTSFINDTNSFCTWNTNTNCTLNTFDTLTHNNDDPTTNKHTFLKQINPNTSNRFVYPTSQQTTTQTTSNFQTVPSANQLLSGEIQVALPVTALVFSQTSTLSTNLIPVQQQQQQQQMSSNTLSNLQQLERQIWFHGRITRKHAETILVNKPVGSFLVRQSESGNSNDFSLSLVGSGCVHMRICMKNGEFILGQCSQPFNSIVKMIDHYGKVEVPIKGAQHVKLTNPVPASI